MFLDVLDTEHVWCLAEVLSTTRSEVEIQYHGWPDKYRETISRKSPRLQQAFTKTGNALPEETVYSPDCSRAY
jgi:hypothetical protein